MDGASLDIAEQRKHELKQLFPGVFTETRNDKGELVETLDFERLKVELGKFSEIYDNRREHLDALPVGQHQIQQQHLKLCPPQAFEGIGKA